MPDLSSLFNPPKGYLSVAGGSGRYFPTIERADSFRAGFDSWPRTLSAAAPQEFREGWYIAERRSMDRFSDEGSDE